MLSTFSVSTSAKRVAVLLSAVLMTSALAASPAQATGAASTFSLTGVNITTTTTGTVVPSVNDDPLQVDYDVDSDTSTFYLIVDSTLDADVNVAIDTLTIAGVTDLSKNTDPVMIAAGEQAWTMRIGTAPTDYTTGLVNAAVILTTHELTPMAFTNTVTGFPSGVSISTSTDGYPYYDESADTTAITIDIVNSSNSNYTLKFTGAAAHNSDSVETDGDVYFYIKKHQTKTIYPFSDGLPGDIRFNSTIAISGTLTAATATKIKSSKLKLPSKFSLAITADQVFYEPATNKSTIGLYLMAPGNTTGVLRMKNAKLNGKTVKTPMVVEGYYDYDLNKMIYYITLKELAGDYRAGKTLTFEGKVVKEKKTTVNQDSINTNSISQDIAIYVLPAAYWVYDAKKKVTKVTVLFYNAGDAAYSINASALTLTTKLKKKGKFKSVTLKSKLKTKNLVAGGFGPIPVGGVFVIPGDVRSNGKAITIKGKLTH